MNLKHHFLLASPLTMGGYFSQSLVYVCEHNEQGAMGFVVNKRLGIKLSDVFKQMSITPNSLENVHWDVMSGGPVEPEVGFILHTPVSEVNATFDSGGIGIATSPEALADIANGDLQGKFIVAVGYTGWAPGQLENELKRQAWLSCPADRDIIFDIDIDQRLKAAGELIGINIDTLSPETAQI